MRHHLLLSFAIVAALGCSAASASTCYIILDRSDTVVYRDVIPPVDLSDRGNAARAAMRRRGEFLLMMESDQCSSFVATSDASGAGGASVEDIVAGLRSYPGAAGGGGVTQGARTRTVGTPAAAPAAAPATAPATTGAAPRAN
jgi:hypothetical protein